ncbi:MAG: hypothetical protein P0120_07410 [Nitrospira sp.]|nr:hypothetical protein [Nitrospira sp.]
MKRRAAMEALSPNAAGTRFRTGFIQAAAQAVQDLAVQTSVRRLPMDRSHLIFCHESASFAGVGCLIHVTAQHHKGGHFVNFQPILAHPSHQDHPDIPQQAIKDLQLMIWLSSD